MTTLRRIAIAMIAMRTIVAFGVEATWKYTVRITAIVDTNPPAIHLQWLPDEYGANSYTVYRKQKLDTSWGTLTTLSGSTTDFTDTDVVVGGAYEYQIAEASVQGYTGYGYIFAGIQAPLIENRGGVVLIVATNSTSALSNELTRLQSDLIGDGWKIIRHDVSSNDTPAAVKSLITSDYFADPSTINSVFLFGHVPILQSGTNLNYDGHEARAMPADAYYGDVDGDWSSLPGFLPSDVELMVGRVDLFDMSGAASPAPLPSETELLRNYLNKDHGWRHKQITVPRRALIGDRRGEESGEATAASGFRNFAPLVGPENTIQANTEDAALDSERWISVISADGYLWGYGCGGGFPTGVSELGTNGQYHDLWSVDMVNADAKAVFVMFFGSWFGNWDGSDNLLRSVLATPSFGLACCMAGRPHWFFHHMGLGETIGYSTRLAMNNSTLYQNQINAFTRAIYIALMGDPTLRMDAVGPPANATATRINSTRVNLAWAASADAVVGYHVYRAVSAGGPFSRLTTAPIAATSFTDTNAISSTAWYMVRAIKLQATPSGNYFNPSQGIFALSPMAITVSAQRNLTGMVLTWNSQSGSGYHVDARTSLTQSGWTNLSGTIFAAGATTSWTDTKITAASRFYRVSSP